MNEQKVTLNSLLSANVYELFVKIILVVVIIFVVIMVMNFLNDKFVNKKKTSRNDYLLDLLMILNKVFYFSGIGFIIANVVEAIFTNSFGNSFMKNFSSWAFLSFGIVLIFIGLGFKYAKKVLVHEREEPENSQK